MIVITEIITMDVPDRYYCNISNYNPEMYIPVNNGNYCVTAKVIQEIIHGQRFTRDSDGVDVVIGMSKQDSDIIGIQLEAFQVQEDRINNLLGEYKDLSVRHEENYRELKKIKSLSFVNKVKFVLGFLK